MHHESRDGELGRLRLPVPVVALEMRHERLKDAPTHDLVPAQIPGIRGAKVATDAGGLFGSGGERPKAPRQSQSGVHLWPHQPVELRVAVQRSEIRIDAEVRGRAAGGKL